MKNALGNTDAAEADFRAGLPIVAQNFGADHIGTLYGQTHLSHVLLCAGKYGEAEATLVAVVVAHERTRPHHPDKLVALSFLCKCYALTGRPEEAARARDRIEAGLDAIGKRGHAWEKELFDAWMPDVKDEGVISSPAAVTATAQVGVVDPPPYDLEKKDGDEMDITEKVVDLDEPKAATSAP